MCGHCKGFYLGNMLDASGGRMFQICQEAKSSGALGALLSGGSDQYGRVPFDNRDLERCLDMARFKVNLHIGLIDRLPATYLSAKLISVDIPSSDRVVSDVYGIKGKGRNDYFHMLDLLEDEGIRYVPHMCVGLENGVVGGEFRTLEMLESYSFEQLVILSMKRTPRADMTKKQINIGDYEKVLKMARDKFKYLCLGCMRDKDQGKEKLWHYFDKIAWPSKIIKDELKENGIAFKKCDTCCSV